MTRFDQEARGDAAPLVSESAERDQIHGAEPGGLSVMVTITARGP